ncbi:MAG: 3-methyladenine DNA glycosylase [Hadesarchaea archaeon]|nr:MAG: 3-methyladenine DNA glycosylase [Hadesarchaea archaeon]HDI12809.1 DNA-3-methyladenine glycosylase [Hadesarchaea archaeon]
MGLFVIPLPRSFYERDTAEVAQGLLGKILVHRSPEGVTSGRIVETEAYYGRGDPASRASRKRTKLNWLMWEMGGLAFVYMVHSHWLFNVTTEREGVPGAVLIRALEPLEGTELMRLRRKTTDERNLASGPGKLTQAMGITYDHHGLDLTNPKSILVITDGENKSTEIASSHRIGVSEDLDRELRFYVRGNPHVSR